MKTQTVKINGMHCASCEKVVTKRISAIPGVQNVQVNVEKGNAAITSENGISQENIADVLKDTHYSDISI